ncbi:phosphotransferase [Shinella sp. CPCC 101442]|uniref:phosphotransferase n=1 Tax=Shinella sp. CPCC 101442 TaxID=2932265 RepID=UPI002152BAD1|nr:phosphotransferase [Shinella sp. CPCC 101442]MCR6498263.1 phosphotransferase [Shinella sp. CPCC 101442]
MHDDQLHIDADIARSMIAEQFPRYRGEPVVLLVATGTTNAIFRVGRHVAARFPLRADEPDACLATLHREAAAMAAFAEQSPFAASQPIGIGAPGPHYPLPWSLQSWLEGDVATPDGLSASIAFARDIAGLIARLRRVDTQGRRFAGEGRGGHLPDHDAWMAVCFEKSEGLLDVARLRDTWRRLRTLPSVGPDRMTHGDLIPWNLLVRGENLVGVLDTGGFGPADPALDLVAAWHLFDRDRRELIRTLLGSGEVEWKRGAAWAFQQAMGLVWYYRASNPAMAALGRSTLTRLLEDADL